MKAKKITLIAFLAVLIVVIGIFKIPTPFVGGSYQLSSPVAVLIAMIFGVGNYILAGVVASLISLTLSLATVYNVLVAMVFRVVVGLIIWIFGRNRFTLVLSSVVGSIVARFVLSVTMHVPMWTLIIPIIPGMIFTCVICYFFYGKVYDLCLKTSAKEFMKEKIS